MPDEEKARTKPEKIKADPSKLKRKKQGPAIEYKTEEQLKADTIRQLEERRLIEAARKPKSEQAKKADNFWYHYKRYVLAGAVGIALIAFFIRDVVFNVKTDFTIVGAGKGYLSIDASDALAARLSAVVPDLNGDGRALVSVDTVRLPQNAISEQFRDPVSESDPNAAMIDMSGASAEMDYASIMKLMAVVASNSDPIMLLDEAGYDYLTRDAAELDENGEMIPGTQTQPTDRASIFYPMPGFNGPNEYAIPIETLGLELDSPYREMFSGMSFYLRNWEGDQKNAELFDSAYAFLMSLTKK